jgi:hypothetical protein
MINEELNRLREFLGPLYDPEKEEMHLQVVRRVTEDTIRKLWETPLLPISYLMQRRFEGIDWNNIRITNSSTGLVGGGRSC